MWTIRTRKLSRYLEGQCHSMTLKQNRVRPITLLFEVGFKTISQKWSPYWVAVSRATFGSLPWRSMSQHDLATKLCPPQNFVIWSSILKLFHRNDPHIESPLGSLHWRWRSKHYLAAKTCPAHNFVIWSRILQLFDRNDHYIEMMCHFLAHCFGSLRTILHYTKKCYLNSQFQWSTEEGMCPFCTS